MPDSAPPPLFLEMGMGVDLVGEDMTTAARRAVRDAIQRTSIPGITRLVRDGDRGNMRVNVTVAVPRPDEVDVQAVAAEFPYGQIVVHPVPGGLRTSNGTDLGPGREHLTIAVAVVAVGV